MITTDYDLKPLLTQGLFYFTNFFVIIFGISKFYIIFAK